MIKNGTSEWLNEMKILQSHYITRVFGDNLVEDNILTKISKIIMFLNYSGITQWTVKDG